MTSGPAADSAVRPARPADVDAIGAVHARAWTASYADVLPAGLKAALDGRTLAAGWDTAVTTPPTPRHRVLVATATDLLTAFAALAPAEDPDTTPDDAEVVAFEVDPAHRGTGHGSRLLNAVADTARDLGFRRLLWWAPEVDGPRITFVRAAGAEPDGARRVRSTQDGGSREGETGDAAGDWAEIRLVALLTADDTPADDTPADDTPADDTPADDTPADDTPVGGTPGDDTPDGPPDPVAAP